MTTLTLSADILENLDRRRRAGESIHVLAEQAGTTWQRLVMALRYGTKAAKPAEPMPAALPAENLLERYRPRRLMDVKGQAGVVTALRRFAAAPYPQVFLFHGETGVGKTSAAIALAGELGCDVDQKPPEFGGLHQIASGEQTAESIRDVYNRIWAAPFSGSGWKVLIVNEAERMHVQAETIWLDRLEEMAPKTTIVFTTNSADKLTARFRDRCEVMGFTSCAKTLRRAGLAFIGSIWRAETGRPGREGELERIFEAAVEEGQFSFRRALRYTGRALGERMAKKERRAG